MELKHNFKFTDKNTSSIICLLIYQSEKYNESHQKYIERSVES